MALIRLLLLVFIATATATATATAYADDRRAEVNYMLHCQGCHLPEGEGFAGKVPRIKDFAGFFLHSGEGRDFLIRVPGVAQSALSDEEVAELMNWLLRSYSADQLPYNYLPFTAAEVRKLRADPERDPKAARTAILDRIADAEPALREIIVGRD
jgi:hypothetical protein